MPLFYLVVYWYSFVLFLKIYYIGELKYSESLIKFFESYHTNDENVSTYFYIK